MARVTHPAGTATIPSPYVELDRAAWARLRENHPLSLSADDITRLRGLGDRLDLAEVEEVYLPLSRLLNFYVGATAGLHRITTDFLGERPEKTPLRHRRRRVGGGGQVDDRPHPARAARPLARTPRVELITTDGFLYPNAELERRACCTQGVPRVLQPPGAAAVRRRGQGGQGRGVGAGVLPPDLRHRPEGEREVVRQPDVLIVEGLNVLQAPRVQPDGRVGLAVSDFFDFSVYVDARIESIKRWYIERFLRLRETAFADPHSYFHRYAALSDEEASATAAGIWEEHQRAQPARERPAHPRPRHPRAGQGRGPQRQAGAPAQALDPEHQPVGEWARLLRPEHHGDMSAQHPEKLATRTEHDSMGEVEVPADALWAAQTARAVENFPVSYQPVPPGVVHALALLKGAAAEVNADLGVLDRERAEAIAAAAGAVAEGRHDDQFPVDVFQTGSGTSTNMNANEVIGRIAHLATGLGHPPQRPRQLRPVEQRHLPERAADRSHPSRPAGSASPCPRAPRRGPRRQGAELADVVKAGRTHLMDAVPVTLGQEFGGYRRQVELGLQRVVVAAQATAELPLGGTAAGTGSTPRPASRPG